MQLLVRGLDGRTIALDVDADDDAAAVKSKLRRRAGPRKSPAHPTQLTKTPEPRRAT